MNSSNDAARESDEPRSSIPFPSKARDIVPEPFCWQTVDVGGDDVSPRIRVGTKEVSHDSEPASGDVLVLDQEVDAPVEVMVGHDVIATGRIVVIRGKLAIEVRQVRQASVRKAG